MPAAKKPGPPDFEKLLSELDRIVQRMEQGDQTLEQTMKDFERGMSLSEQCQKSLDQAQQRVDKLVRKHGLYQVESGDDLLHDEDEGEDEDSFDEDLQGAVDREGDDSTAGGY
jgi:exodeoxyribonuclease VII small subunit